MKERRSTEISHLQLTPGRWWRVLDKDGNIWCETSDEQEARDSMKGRSGDTLQRLYVANYEEWREAE